MIDTLKKHITEINEHLVDEIIYTLKENNINSFDELIEFENEQFTVNGKLLNQKERIQYASKITLEAYWDYDGLTKSKINTLRTLKDSLSENINDEEKIYNLIKIFDMTELECLFICEAYNLITSDKL